MLIIIEGPDNTGKTTLARRLQDVFSLEYIHCSKPKTDNPFQEYCDLIEGIQKPTVIDRAHLGEYVYSQLWRGGCTITEKQFEYLDLMCMDKFNYVIVIHAQAPNDIILERCKKNDEKLLLPHQIEHCSELFKDIVSKTQIPVINYFSHLQAVEEFVDDLCRNQLNIG